MKITSLILFFVLISCSSEFKHNPSIPYPDLKVNSYWVNQFDQRGLQNATIIKDLLFVNTVNIGKGQNFLYCLDLKTGKVKWKQPVKNYASNPVMVSNNTILFSTYLGDVYGFSIDGIKLWHNKYKGSFGGMNVNSSKKTLIIRGVYNGFSEYNIKTGKLIKNYENHLNTSIPTVEKEDLIYSTSNKLGKYIKRVSSKTDSIKWIVNTKNNYKRALKINSKIILTDIFSNLLCLDIETGKTVWSIDKDKNQTFISMNIIDDKFICKINNALYSIDTDTGIKTNFIYPSAQKRKYGNNINLDDVKYDIVAYEDYQRKELIIEILKK